MNTPIDEAVNTTKTGDENRSLTGNEPGASTVLVV